MMMQEMGTNPDNYQLIKSLEYYQTIIVIERMLAHSNSHVSSNSYRKGNVQQDKGEIWKLLLERVEEYEVNLNTKKLAAGIHRSRK